MVKIDFGTHQTITTGIITNNNGTFSITFIVSTQPAGDPFDPTNNNTPIPKYITATGSISPEQHTTQVFNILQRIKRVFPSSGVVGDFVTVEGDGFTKTEGDFAKIFFETTQVFQFNPEQNGFFQKTFQISAATAGTKGITVKNEMGGGYWEIKSTFVFEVKPKFSIKATTPRSGKVGSTITVKGTSFGSFTSNNAVRIDFGTNNTITTATPDSNGFFEITFAVDTQLSGSATITATQRGNILSDIYYIRGNITLINPPNGPIGQIVTLQGTGYGTSGETLKIDFGTQESITTSTITSSNGTFSITFVTNTQKAGARVVTIKGTPSGEEETTIFTITAKIYLVYPASGKYNTPVTVQGSGYEPGNSVDIRFGLDDPGQSIEGNSATTYGTFSGTSYTINEQRAGSTVITANDSISGDPWATTVFDIRPDISGLNPVSGTVGTTITIEGRGYHQEIIAIHFGTHQTITTVPALNVSVRGTFSYNFTVSQQQAGSTVITAIDQTGYYNTTVFVITGKITLISPISGRVGDYITVEGNGYQTGETIRIDFGTHKTITTVVASGNGTFSTSFKVNTQLGGTTQITAYGTGTGSEAKGIFIIISGSVGISPFYAAIRRRQRRRQIKK